MAIDDGTEVPEWGVELNRPIVAAAHDWIDECRPDERPLEQAIESSNLIAAVVVLEDRADRFDGRDGWARCGSGESLPKGHGYRAPGRSLEIGRMKALKGDGA